MKKRLVTSRILIFCILFAQVFGGYENQVSAATQIAKKSSLVSLCLNPAGNAARAAQDDRCSKGSVTSSTTTTVPAKTVKTVKPVETTEPVKTNNKNVASAVGTTVPVIANVSNISTGTSSASGATGSAGSNVAVVLPVEIPGLISVCVNKSTSVLRDTADNSCSASNEVKVEWLDTGMSPKICVNNNNRQMTLAQDGKCSTKNSAVADVTANKQILACADDKTGVLRYQASGVCGVNNDPVAWVLKDQGVARNVDSGVKQGVVEIISLIPTAGSAGASTGTSSPKTVTTSPATNTSSVTTTATTTTTTIAVTTTVPTTTTSTSSTTTTTVASRVSGSFAGYLGGNCPDGSGLPWYWGSDGRARAGGCSAAASIAPISTGGSGSSDSAATTTTTVAPVVVPGTPATPTGVAGNTQVTVSVTAGTGGTPTSYTITKSTTSGGTYSTGCTVTGASGSCVVTGLTNGTAYFFKTTATNSAGTSSLSTASSAVTPATVPDAPTIGTATVASATSVTVACTAPGSNGGAAIDSYTFTSSPAGGTVTINSLTCTTTTITGLTTGTAYTFTVTATNSRGTSVASAVSNSVTPATVYTVGSTGPGGGLVFYVASGTFTSTGSDCNTACKYFEVAPSDQGINIPVATTAAFCYAAGSNSGVSDCQRNSIYSNTDGQAASRNASTAIGMGMANTNALYARMTTAGGAAVSTYNAGIAWAYSNNGKTDWHLPSKDELNQLCKWNGGLAYVSDATVCTGGTLNSATNGANGSAFTTNAYWSSSEYSIDATQSQNFPTGNVNLGFFRGDADKRFRAVRAFG